MKRLFLLLMIAAMLLCGCSKSDTMTTKSGIEITKPSKEIQNTPAESGETIAIMTIKDYGDIKIKFFPESAPKAVENFLTLASQGYYDGLTFHRIIDDFMIQGGDPTGTGSGGESCWGGSFEDEFTSLVPIYGSLCMANSGPDTNGSQFFIVEDTYGYPEYLGQFGLSEAQQKLFLEYGGTPWLYKAHTVFGHVYEGMDVVKAVASVQVDPQYSMPYEPVIIEKIEIKTAE